MPLVGLHGTTDTLTSPAGGAALFDAAGVGDKTRRPYEGALHHLFGETNRGDLHDDMAA